MKLIYVFFLINISIFSLFHFPKVKAQLHLVGLSGDTLLLGHSIKTPSFEFYHRRDIFSPKATEIPTQVTFEIKNPRFKSIDIHSPLVFGASSRSTMNLVHQQPILQPFRNLGKPSPSLFRLSETEEGHFSTTYNYGVCLFASIRHLSQSKTPGPEEKIEYADLHITFNRLVSNPVLHFNGLGSLLEREGIKRGFSMEFELIYPAAAQLVKWSGSDNLEVSDRYVGNSAQKMHADYGSGAASGSVLVRAEDLQELVFRVYVKRDQRKEKYRGRWPLLRNIHPGDAALISITFESDHYLNLRYISDLDPNQTPHLRAHFQKPKYFLILDPASRKVLCSKSFDINTSNTISGLTRGSSYLLVFSDHDVSRGQVCPSSPIHEDLSIKISNRSYGFQELQHGEFLIKPSDIIDFDIDFTIISKKD